MWVIITNPDPRFRETRPNPLTGRVTRPNAASLGSPPKQWAAPEVSPHPETIDETGTQGNAKEDILTEAEIDFLLKYLSPIYLTPDTIQDLRCVQRDFLPAHRWNFEQEVCRSTLPGYRRATCYFVTYIRRRREK